MIENLIKKVAQSLDEEQISYMIIGGQAVLLYGTPRLTRDIDITLGVDTDKLEPVKKICLRCGLKILPENPEEFVRQTNVLAAEEPKIKIRVDFIFSFTQYEAQAITRTKKVLIDDYPVKFASCEDVIIHKMVAARAVDIEDVKNMLIKNKDTLNFEYTNKWLTEFDKVDEHKGILERFNSLRNQ